MGMRGNGFHFLVMSHSLLWRHIVLLTVGVYSSNHRVLYTITTHTHLHHYINY